MNSKNKKGTATLEIFRELYDSAELYHREAIEKMERNMRQYLGSPEIDGSAEPAATVRNITFEIVESEVSASIPLPALSATLWEVLF